jgi:hypothetical protein
MFLRCKVRRKDGKQHRYWSVVENTRVAGGRVAQRHVLIWVRSTTLRSWRGGGRSRLWKMAARGHGHCRCFRKTAAPKPGALLIDVAWAAIG